MTAYEMFALSYESMLEEGKIDKETAEKEIRIFRFLDKCDEDDICRLVDSGAFNGVIRAYIRAALSYADVDADIRAEVIRQSSWLFDSVSAKDALKNYSR